MEYYANLLHFLKLDEVLESSTYAYTWSFWFFFLMWSLHFFVLSINKYSRLSPYGHLAITDTTWEHQRLTLNNDSLKTLGSNLKLVPQKRNFHALFSGILMKCVISEQLNCNCK